MITTLICLYVALRLFSLDEPIRYTHLNCWPASDTFGDGLEGSPKNSLFSESLWLQFRNCGLEPTSTNFCGLFAMQLVGLSISTFLCRLSLAMCHRGLYWFWDYYYINLRYSSERAIFLDTNGLRKLAMCPRQGHGRFKRVSLHAVENVF